MIFSHLRVYDTSNHSVMEYKFRQFLWEQIYFLSKNLKIFISYSLANLFLRSYFEAIIQNFRHKDGIVNLLTLVQIWKQHK